MKQTQQSAIDELIRLSTNVSNQAVEAWKAKGKAVVGYLCSYIPEEVFYAADIMPYRIGARGCRETTNADSLMASITCSFCRSCLEFALSGEYRFLDGLVYMNGCETMRRMADNWRHKVEMKFVHVLSVPQRSDGPAVQWYKEELGSLIEYLGKTFGTRSDNNSLKDAIQFCNRARELLKQLYDLRKAKNPLLSGAEVQRMVVMSTAMPKQEYNKLLEQAIDEAKRKQELANYRARIMVVGNMLDDPIYTEIIEDVGGLVVADASCYGSLSFWELVKATDDPLDGIARAYLNGVPCPRQPFSNAALASFIGGMIKDFDVEGVIFERMVHCSLWSCETLSLEKDARDLNIPLLILEREYFPSGIGQLRTRIQAFLEVIEGGKRGGK